MTSPVNSTEFINRAVLERQQRAKSLLPKPTEQADWIFPHLNSHYVSLSVYLGSSGLLGLADVVVMKCDASGVVTDARGWNRLEHMATRVLALHTCTPEDGDELASDFMQFRHHCQARVNLYHFSSLGYSFFTEVPNNEIFVTSSGTPCPRTKLVIIQVRLPGGARNDDEIFPDGIFAQLFWVNHSSPVEQCAAAVIRRLGLENADVANDAANRPTLRKSLAFR